MEFNHVLYSRWQHYGLESNESVLKTFCSCSNKNVHLPSRHFCTRLSSSDEDGGFCVLVGADDLMLIDSCKLSAVCSYAF